LPTVLGDARIPNLINVPSAIRSSPDRGSSTVGVGSTLIQLLRTTVGDRDCQALLGHARRGVTRHFMAPEVARLRQAAESVLETEHRGTIPLTIIRRKVA
jgi:hypothetical protein